MPPQTRKSEDLSVVEVRRHLNEIRKRWRASCPEEPIYTATQLTTDFTVAEFAFAFVQSHHRPRAAPRSGP